MLIYGRNAVIEAIREGQAIRLLLAQGLNKTTIREFEKLADKHDLVIRHVPRIELDQELKTTNHQGIVAELASLKFAEPDAPFQLAKKRGERLLLILLDQLSDPRNYGAIIRSAEAFGAHGVISEERRSAPLSPVAVKASAGATSYIPLIQVKNLPRYIDDLKSKNIWVYGAAGEAYNHPRDIDWDRDAALVIGSEGTGLRRLVRDKCDDMLAINLKGQIQSLNASVAAGIMIHEIINARSATKSD